MGELTALHSTPQSQLSRPQSLGKEKESREERISNGWKTSGAVQNNNSEIGRSVKNTNRMRGQKVTPLYCAYYYVLPDNLKYHIFICLLFEQLYENRKHV